MLPSHFINFLKDWGTAGTSRRQFKILGEIMKKIICVVGVTVLFILTSGATASAKPADSAVAKKQEQRISKRHAARKASAKRVVEAAPKHFQKKAASGIHFKYIKVKDPLPWYYNFWVLFMGGSMLFLAGGIVGRILSFGPIPREGEEAEEGVGSTDNSRVKKFLRKLGFFKAS